MDKQRFSARAGSADKASYQLIVPLVNLNQSCRLEVRDSSNMIVPFTLTGQEATITRADSVGEHRFSFSLIGRTGEGPEGILSQRQVEVSIRHASSVPNSTSGGDRELVINAVKDVGVETAASMGGPYLKAPNLAACWRQLNEQLDGREAGPLCDMLAEPHDFKIYWVALSFLNFTAADVRDPAMLERILATAGDHISGGGHVQAVALQLIQSLDVDRAAVWKVLVSTLRSAEPHATAAIIRIIIAYIPEDGLEKTGSAIVRAMRTMRTDHEVAACISVLEQIDCRDAGSSLRGVLLTPNMPQASGRAAMLLAKWEPEAAAAIIRKYLDTAHRSVSQLYIQEAMRALFLAEGASSLPYLSEILPNSQPYVLKNLGNELFGELRKEPLIHETARKIEVETTDAEIKKALADFLSKATRP